MDWLESNFSKNGAPDLSEKFFIWENTWEALKRDKLVDKSSSSSMVSNIDPDAPTREGKQLHPLDNVRLQQFDKLNKTLRDQNKTRT